MRLPRIVGLGRALDLILTGRAVSGEEALGLGLVDRVVDPGQALAAALELAREIARLPQRCLRSDRLAVYDALGHDEAEGLPREFARGLGTLRSAETLEGARRFHAGAGRHGKPA